MPSQGGVLAYRSCHVPDPVPQECLGVRSPAAQRGVTRSVIHSQGAWSLFGTSSTGAPRALSTGHLLADCERWCRDALPPRTLPSPAQAPALRIVVTPPSVAAPAPARRGTFRPGAGWPDVAMARTGS